MMVTEEDLIAIHRANDSGGPDAALAELRRRWPGIREGAVPEVLDRVLAMSVAVPKPEVNGIRSVPRHEGKMPKRSTTLMKPKCNDPQSSAARPDFIGQNLSTFGETIAPEPPRDCRRLFHVSHAAMAVRSISA